MSTAELKYSLFKVIDAISDNKTLSEIYSFVSQKTDAEFWQNLSPEQKAEIEIALKDLDAGLGILHDKVMAPYKGKYM
jgi:hypothetical protein